MAPPHDTLFDIAAPRTILVTGGAGFIGSAVIRRLIAESQCRVVNLDKLTYAGNLESLAMVADHPRYRFERIDICHFAAVEDAFRRHRPDAIMHLAAESHVDRSIGAPRPFIDTNVVGTYTLLEVARAYWEGLDAAGRRRFRFHHISTDEVYGSLGADDLFREDSPYRPKSPYSATKAASDHLVRAWQNTYGLPTIVTNCSNNYGPYQFPEKLIPVLILSAHAGRPLPIYGKGDNVRDWLYVDDHAEALCQVLVAGPIGETYNIGGNSERTNLEVAKTVCGLLDELMPNAPHRPHASLIRFVEDRPGHDKRYAVDAGHIGRTLGWAPKESFESGIAKTVAWYLENRDWWERIRSGAYRHCA